MRGFFGILRLDPSNTDDLTQFLTSSPTQGENMVLAEDYLMMGFREENLLTDPKNQALRIVGWARIDNRNQLASDLHMANLPSDLGLILESYRKWGIDCLKHLIGDFSFVLVDENSSTFLLAKDPLGIRPLFYAQHNGLLFFSTRITDLKKVLPHPLEINLPYVARELKGYVQPVENTFFKSIHRLKPAHYLSVEKVSPLAERRYWELTKLPLSDCRSEADYHARVLACLKEAVRCRIAGKTTVGCQLSGGMDSSAIAVLLSRLMPVQQLHTYSFVLSDETIPYSPNGIDEQATQAEIINFAGLDPTNHHPITGFHYKDVFEELDTRNEVMGGLANSDTVWQDTLFKQAAEANGVEVMFSGFPGDEGISTTGGNYFHEYLHTLDVPGLLSHLARFRLRAVKGIVHYYWSMFKGSSKPEFRKIQDSRNLLHPSSPLHGVLKDQSFPFEKSFSSFLKHRMCRSHTTLRTESEGSYANRHGIETVYPLADVRLLQLVYSLPVHLFAPKPYGRALFRNLTKDILPENVRLQPKFNGAKTLAFADYWIKIKTQQLKDYVPTDRFGLFIEKLDASEEDRDPTILTEKRGNLIKEVDYFLEKNCPPMSHS
ncbi:asparagine synthase (glutamine-hydrolyzing) [Lunatimonas lonarensis]|uniref:asparagine synthase (glutamine-hydrolyzing) n=1 Tax=Lunatimonas lonarensis TaxID=1232681 RepID=R7ZNA1_9BACT|nr:asparagine synthase-related protein [Lunatimonas lonarensis]EON75557.1 asparagine synthase (glutamine-hydrolyzing) [Lunatimonas lonarensis]